jgi:transketolase
MGESIAQLLTNNHPVPMEFVAVNDKFGESGKPADLMKKYGLHSSDIIKATHRVLKRK